VLHLSSWHTVVVAFAGAVLALALSPAAGASSGLPAVVGLRSPSHPDSSLWYADSDPAFSWASSSPGATFVDGYACRLDQNPSGDPGTTLTDPALAFAAQQTYAVGNGAIALVAADLSGNGRVDLVTANYNDDTISVLLSKGDGTFSAAQTYTVGSLPWGLAVADFNGDGHPDIAVSNFGGDSVSVLLNKGDGTFSAAQTYAVGAHPEGIATADLTGDGHADLVVVNHGDEITDGTVSVLMNNGDGSFAAQETYSVGVGPAFVAIGDLNGDGYPDVAVSNFVDNSVSVLLNNGDGGFAAQKVYPVGNGPACVAIADLNGDGHPDLAIAEHGADTAGVLLNTGDGTFGTEHTYAAGDGPQGIAVADLNGDGHPDLVVADRSAPTLDVLVGTGDGAFAAPRTFAVGQSAWRVVAADLNGDGHLDLAVANAGDATLGVLLDEGGLTSFTGAPDGTWYFHVRAHDAAGDWGGTSSVQVNIETAGPVTTATGLSADSNPAWSDNPVVTLQASDVSGVAATYYTLDGGARQTYSGPFDLQDGVHTVTYWSVDKAGNAEAPHAGHARIDTTDPVTTATGLSASSNPAWSDNPTVTLQASDDVSGVAATYYTLDGGARQTYSGPFDLQDGVHTVTYWSVDQAGNVEAPHSGYVNIDTTAPTTTAPGLSAAANPAWTNKDRLSLTASDDLSGVAATYYTVDGGAQQTYSAPFTLADGPHTVTYWSIDKAGNVEAPHSGYVRIDTIGPTTLAHAASGHRGKPIALRFMVRDNLSSRATSVVLTIRTSRKAVVKRIGLGSVRTAVWYVAQWTPKARGTYTYTVSARDSAGNGQSRAGSAKITVR
jgi:hypothetical protein